jgi:hypothetical protein
MKQNVGNNTAESMPCEAKNGDRAFPTNLLGGYRWPGARRLDRRTMANILSREIGEPPKGAARDATGGTDRKAA